MSTNIKEGGRMLLVEFTCGRCGKVELVPYEHSDNYAVRSNMNSTPVPQGWRAALSGLPMLCDTCNRALERFMNDTKEVPECQQL